MTCGGGWLVAQGLGPTPHLQRTGLRRPGLSERSTHFCSRTNPAPTLYPSSCSPDGAGLRAGSARHHPPPTKSPPARPPARTTHLVQRVLLARRLAGADRVKGHVLGAERVAAGGGGCGQGERARRRSVGAGWPARGGRRRHERFAGSRRRRCAPGCAAPSPRMCASSRGSTCTSSCTAARVWRQRASLLLVRWGRSAAACAPVAARWLKVCSFIVAGPAGSGAARRVWRSALGKLAADQRGMQGVGGGLGSAQAARLRG